MLTKINLKLLIYNLIYQSIVTSLLLKKIMKKTIIYEKKKTTIGEIYQNHEIFIYFILIVIFNFFMNIYIQNESLKCLNDETCTNLNTIERLHYYMKQSNYLHNIIKFELFILPFIILYKKYIKLKAEYIDYFNYFVYFVVIPAFCYYEFGRSVFNPISNDNMTLKFTFIHLYYVMGIFMSVVLFVTIIILGIFVVLLLGLSHIVKKIHLLYKKHVENIEIEYVDIKNIEIDKIV